MKLNEKQEVVSRFSFKNAFMIFLAGLLGGVLMPYVFDLWHFDPRMAVIMFLPILMASAIAYGQCFIESRQGLSSKFFRIVIIAWSVLTFASYAWLYKGVIF